MVALVEMPRQTISQQRTQPTLVVEVAGLMTMARRKQPVGQLVPFHSPAVVVLRTVQLVLLLLGVVVTVQQIPEEAAEQALGQSVTLEEQARTQEMVVAVS
jgi:hypothetical protein